MISQLSRIADLQLDYSSSNTPAMQERGRLIRGELPELLRLHLNRLKENLGRFGSEMEIEGRDGIGRKTEAPWIRLYSNRLSRSATSGFYIVIHFSIDGQRCYITLGCGATQWNSGKGDLIEASDEELEKKVRWAQEIFSESKCDTSYFGDLIHLGASASLPRKFEKATVFAKELNPHTVDLETFLAILCRGLVCLAAIYEAVTQGADLKSSDAIEIDINATANPVSRLAKGQGYGLSFPERKAIELRAMDITRQHLEGAGYRLEDTSATESFDFLAIRNNEEIMVEVKGATCSEVDSILMTAREVELHSTKLGQTALAIVSKIELTRRGENAECTGGILEFIFPWDIRDWDQTPKAFSVSRRSVENRISI